MREMNATRFAIFETGYASPYCLDRYGNYPDLFEIFMSIDREPWKVFDVQKGEYPEDLSQFDVILLTGSAADAHAREPWIIRLEEEVRKAHELGLYILGFCFGHQCVANALGGKTGRNPAGWEVGLFELDFVPEFFEQPWALDIKSIKMLEIHQDHVIEPPPGAKVWASTPDTPIQMYTLGDKVFCMQGHPEFKTDMVHDLMEKRWRAGIIPEEVIDKAIENTFRKQPDHLELRLMVNEFIRRPLNRWGKMPTPGY